MVAQFALTNRLDPSITPSNGGESRQSSDVNGVVSCALLVQITNALGVPQPDLAVDFSAALTGSSSTLWHGAENGSSLTVITDEDGFAWVDAEANGIVGPHVVSAQLKYSLSAPFLFHLRNLAAGDAMWGNGFDGPCLAANGPVSITVPVL